MNKLTNVKIKRDDGTYSNEIPIAVSAQYVKWNSSYNIKQVLGNVRMNDGDIQTQIDGINTEIDVDITGIQDQINAIDTEINDAHIDTLGVDWSEDNPTTGLGHAIRGQINGLKNYLLNSGILNSVQTVIQGEYFWSINPLNNYKIEPTNGELAVVALMKATISNSPQYLSIRNYYPNTPKGYYIFFLAENDGVIGIYRESAVSGEFNYIQCPLGTKKIAFSCEPDQKHKVIVLSSNDSYGTMKSKTFGNIQGNAKCYKNVEEIYWKSDSYNSSFQVIEDIPSITQNSILHVSGNYSYVKNFQIYLIDCHNGMYVCLHDYVKNFNYAGSTSQNIDFYISIYKLAKDAVTSGMSIDPNGLLKIAIMGKPDGNSYSLLMGIRVSLATETSKISEDNNAAPIYTKTYSGYYESTLSSDVSDIILDTEWDYKNTIVDYEVNYTVMNAAKARNQASNPGRSQYQTSGRLNKPLLTVDDSSNGGGHTSSKNAQLIMVPAIPDGYYNKSNPMFYTVTVYYTKNNFTVALEANKFEVISGTAYGGLIDAGTALQAVIGANSTVVIQSKNPISFRKLLQTFNKQISGYSSSCDFTCEIALYKDNIKEIFVQVNLVSGDITSGWNGVELRANDNYLLPGDYYLRYTITNNSSNTGPFALGPAMFFNVPDSCIDNI